MRLVPLALCIALVGCADKKSPLIKIVLAHGASAASRCVGNDVPLDGPLAGVDTVRISVVTHKQAGDAGLPVCDRVLAFGKQSPNLRLPVTSARTFDLHVEAFGPGANGQVGRIASGSLIGLDPAAKSTAPVLMYPSELFRCVNSRLAQPRAFHSAVALPDGKVLVVGGLVADPMDKTIEVLDKQQLFFVTGGAELYDPADGAFHPITEPTPQPRAFHAAAALPDLKLCPGASYAVLLVGGMTTTQPNQAVLGPTTGQQGSRLIPFDTSMLIANPLPARAAPSEVMCVTVSGAGVTATRTALPGGPAPGAFQAAAPLKSGLAIAGGIDFSNTLNMPINGTELATLASDGTKTSGQVAAPRLGGAMALLAPPAANAAPDRALIWGGATTPTDPVALIVNGLSQGALSSTALTAPMGTVPTQFQTATPVSDGQKVLVTGGFQVIPGGIDIQPPPADKAVLLVTPSGTAVASDPVPLGAFMPRYKPAGWESAVALKDGRVLVSGGAPAHGASSTDCEDAAAAGLLCAITQAGLFDGTTLSPTTGSMLVRRFGHSSTVLPDGNVLILGGVNFDGAMTRTLADAEIYNPHRLLPPYNPAQPTAGDADDPLSAALMKLTAADGTPRPLLRAPGAEAVSPSAPKTPAMECPSL
jgi:hypothetical protein